MADCLPERPAAALARTPLRPGNGADHLDVPGGIAERGNAVEGTDTRQRPRLVARGRVKRQPADDGVSLVPGEDVGPRFVDLAGISDPADRDASQRRFNFPRGGLTAPPPRGPGHQ